MKVLVLSRWFPYPPDNGSKVRIFNWLRILAERHDIALMTFVEPGQLVDAARLQPLREYCSSIQVLPYRAFRPCSWRALLGLMSRQPRSLIDTFQPAMRAAVENEAARTGCDVILTSELDMVPYAMHLRDIPAVLEDLELTAYDDARRGVGSLGRRWRAQLTWLKLTAFLRLVLPRFQACTVVSEPERCRLQKLVPAYSAIEVLPNALDLTQYTASYGPPCPGTLIYSGALTYDANYDAVAYFVWEILPMLRRAVSDVRLLVTGERSSLKNAPLPSAQGVQYTGYLADVRPVIAESWLSIVPLRRGAGTRVKVLESMALGTPVVATSKGAEGLAVTPGLDILLADQPSQFADSICALLNSSELRSKLADNARRLIEARYDLRGVGQVLETLVERAATGSA